VLGRVISYFVLGGLIGLLGKAFQLTGPMLGILTIAVGFVMLILGAQLTEMFPRLSSGSFTLPSSISKILGIKKHHEKEYSHSNSMLVGALTFFLPCGFTQAMQLYAMSTGNLWMGASIMGVFALGTAPGLLGIGGLTSVLKGAFAKKFFKFTGLVVIFLAIFNISNGWNLTGWKSIFLSESSSKSVVKDDPNVKMEDGIQIVRMTQTAYGYKPNKFTIMKGIPVKWIIDSIDSNSCAASILMPKQNIRKSLKPGDNIIQFTAKETGELKFTCGMGM
jgi:sulfite exporter TauE/SafE